jgi:hypothetical protein
MPRWIVSREHLRVVRARADQDVLEARIASIGQAASWSRRFADGLPRHQHDLYVSACFECLALDSRGLIGMLVVRDRAASMATGGRLWPIASQLVTRSV